MSQVDKEGPTAREFLEGVGEDLAGNEPVVEEAYEALVKADNTGDPEDQRSAQKAFARVEVLIPQRKRIALFGILSFVGASIVLLTLKEVISHRRRR